MTETIETTTPERYMKSPITGKTYRVTEWLDKGDGKFVALEKEAIEDQAECDDA